MPDFRSNDHPEHVLMNGGDSIVTYGTGHSLPRGVMAEERVPHLANRYRPIRVICGVLRFQF